MKRLHTQGIVLEVGDQVLRDVVQGTGAGGDVGSACLDSGHSGSALLSLIQGHIAQNDISLGRVVGDGEAQLIGEGLHVIVGGTVAVHIAVVDIAIALAEPLGEVSFGHGITGEGGIPACQEYGGFGDSSGIWYLSDPGSGKHILLRNGGVIRIGQHEVTLVGPRGDHAHGLSAVKQGIHRTDGLVAAVGQDHKIAGGTGELRGTGDGGNGGQLTGKSARGGDGHTVKATHGGEVGY